MDSLSNYILKSDLNISIDKYCNFDKTWRAPHKPGPIGKIRWHFVVKGSCKIDIPDANDIEVNEKTIVFINSNLSHCMRNNNDQSTEIICGEIDLADCQLLLNTSLPEITIYPPKVSDSTDNSLEKQDFHVKTVNYINDVLEHFSDGDLGRDAIITYWIKIAFMISLSDEIKQGIDILPGLLHPKIGGCIRLMLDKPEYPWKISELASSVNMSRASFFRLYKQITNSSPIDTLIRIRMRVALQYLSRNSFNIDVIGQKLGYSSSSVFIKQFTGYYGISPGKMRKKLKELEQ